MATIGFSKSSGPGEGLLALPPFQRALLAPPTAGNLGDSRIARSPLYCSLCSCHSFSTGVSALLLPHRAARMILERRSPPCSAQTLLWLPSYPQEGLSPSGATRALLAWSGASLVPSLHAPLLRLIDLLCFGCSQSGPLFPQVSRGSSSSQTQRKCSLGPPQPPLS